MNSIIGKDIVRIDAPQDRSELVIEALNGSGSKLKIRFANDDGTRIDIAKIRSKKMIETFQRCLGNSRAVTMSKTVDSCYA